MNETCLFIKKTLADWDQVHARRRAQHMRDNARENKSRIDYKYKKGDRVRIITTPGDRQGKLYGYEHKGPFEITAVHNNATVTIQCGNFKERINIRRLKRVSNKPITG